MSGARTAPGRLRGAALALLLLSAAGGWFWWSRGLVGWVRRGYPVGIDVSHHQGAIDWSRVRAAGVAFAFIKATEGATFTDPAFLDNWRGAGRSGLPRGAYHFFTFCRAGREQAAHFIDVVPAEEGSLPPLIDLEMEGNCSARPDASRLKEELDAFLGIVEPRYGREAILYVTEEFYARYGVVTEGRELFLREPFLQPGWSQGRRWAFWQFHPGGRVDGIEGAVDLDAFNGSTAELGSLGGEAQQRGREQPLQTKP